MTAALRRSRSLPDGRKTRREGFFVPSQQRRRFSAGGTSCLRKGRAMAQHGHNRAQAVPGTGPGTDGPFIYCKLFADMVTRHLCMIRRQELDSQDGFSCDGCDQEQGSDGPGPEASSGYPCMN